MDYERSDVFYPVGLPTSDTRSYYYPYYHEMGIGRSSRGCRGRFCSRIYISRRLATDKTSHQMSRSNQALEPTATRRVFTFQMIKAVSVKASRALGRPSLTLFSLGAIISYQMNTGEISHAD